MKKRVSAILATLLICTSVFSQEVMAFELPDPSELGKLASEAASGIADAAGTAGGAIADAAGTAGGAIADAAGTADDAIGAVTDAGGFVVDRAGHVIDLAAAAADYVSSEATEALQVLQRYGTLLMNLAEAAVSGIDLSKEESWEEAKAAVDAAVDKAFDEGIIDREKVSEEAIQIATRIVFGALMYGYQYKNEQITLGDYVSAMSEVLIREGLPTGVGFLVSILPINKIPHAESLAKEATIYLISKAYGDEPGNEIEAEEEALLEAVAETEEMTEKES